MKKKLQLNKIFSIILPSTYVIIHIYNYSCGERLGVWSECMGGLAFILATSNRLNPLYWVVVFLSNIPESDYQIVFGTILLLLSYIFGIVWFYFLGKLIDATLYKIYFGYKRE